MFGPYNRKHFLRRLNAPETPGTGSHRRKSENLLRIVELVGQINGMDLAQAAKAPPLSNRFTVDEREVTTFSETRLEEIEAELNARAGYANLSIVLTPNFSIKKGKLRCRLLPTTLPAMRETASQPDMFILADLQEAITAGDLEKLKRCECCREWFFRRVDDQRFCKGQCRKTAFESTDKYKAQRAVYMKQFRRDEKERKEREGRAMARKNR